MLRKIASGIKKDFKDESFLEILKGSAATFIIRIIGLFVGYLFVFLISRFYGSDVLGAHTLSTTVLMMFSIVGRLGMDTAIVKHFAPDHESGRWDRVLEVYQKTLRVVIPTGIILSIILYFGSGLIAEYIFRKPMLEPYFRIISFAVLPMILRFINSECYRGFRMNKEYAYSQNVSYFMYASAILGVVGLYYKTDYLPNIAFTLSLAILAITSTMRIRKKITGFTVKPSNEYSYRDLLRISTPMMLTSSMMLISGWINTIMLGIFATESDVGIYSVILKISTFSSFILMSINSVSAPRFAQLHAAGNHIGLSRYTAHTAKIIFFTSIPIFLVIIFFRTWLLGLFGEEFKIGSDALLVTMAGQFFNVFAGSVGHFLNMTGNQDAFRKIITLSAVVNVIACAILIPKLGLMGSAIAGMIFLACWNLISMVYIRVKLNIRTYFWPFDKEETKH